MFMNFFSLIEIATVLWENLLTSEEDGSTFVCLVCSSKQNIYYSMGIYSGSNTVLKV